ncbi:MAG: glycosyl transferase family 1 [Cellvibrionales bacterium]|nr:MAG: glycosyl transferase family 1 [Cellvibrionales bacterium]
MKVGVDARLLSRPLTGIGRYTLEMCLALSKLDGVSLYLYSPAPFPHAIMSALQTTTIRTLHCKGPVLRQLWGTFILPLWAKQDQVDIFWGPSHRLPGLLPKATARVVTIHDLVWKYAGETMRPISRLRESIQMPHAIKNADAVVADSTATADAINAEFNILNNKLNTVLLGASQVPTSPSLLSLTENAITRPYFLFIGTLEPRKNLNRLLTAYSRLPMLVKEKAMLVIAGGKGWGGVDIETLINDLNLSEHVRLLGYVDEATLAGLYSNALFLAMPSLYEGFGLPLLEAMTYGTPVLTANNSSMPEVSGDAGLFVDALDIDSIARGLEQLISDESVLEALADNTASNVKRFSWDNSAQQLLDIFKEAITARHLRIH